MVQGNNKKNVTLALDSCTDGSRIKRSAAVKPQMLFI